AIDEEKQHEWPRKVRRRAQFDRAWMSYEQLASISSHAEMGFQAHTMAWSRVDYLIAQDRQKFGLLLRQLKSRPLRDGSGKPEDVRKAMLSLLEQLFHLDPASFDQNWRQWVLKTYPQK